MRSPSALYRLPFDQGGRLWREGNRLEIEAPDSVLTPEFLAEFRAQKPELLALADRLAPLEAAGRMACQIFDGRITERTVARSGGDLLAEVAAWPEALRERFEERAAIREFDGGFPRAEAERLAFGDVRNGA